MPLFSDIEFWPQSGWEDKLWTDDPATDALVRSAVRVSEAYSFALQEERLEGPCVSLRFFSHLHDGNEVQLQVDTDKPEDWESGIVSVPEVVCELSAHDRALLVLDLIHDAVLQLAPHREWPLDVVERIRARVIANDLEFVWSSPWKASPDRSMAARAVFRIADDGDGYGRATIEVQDRKTEELIARSARVPAYGSLVSFKQSAKTLRWVKRSITLVPRPGWPHGDDVLSLAPETFEIHPEPAPDRPEQAQDSVPVPPIVRTPYGSHQEDKTPGLDLYLGLGIGTYRDTIPVVDGMHFNEAIELEIFDRLGPDEAGVRQWLEELPVEIDLNYDLPGAVDGFGEYGIRLRRTVKLVRVSVIRDGSWLTSEDISDSVVRHEVTETVEQVMAALRARAKKAARR